MGSYRDLKVYEKSYELAVLMYKVMKRLPREETFGLISQVKRASTSIPLNIAEGYGKGVQGKELIRFLTMARGSCSEMKVLLELCKDLGFIEEMEIRTYMERYNEVGKMLTGLIKSAATNN